MYCVDISIYVYFFKIFSSNQKKTQDTTKINNNRCFLFATVEILFLLLDG